MYDQNCIFCKIIQKTIPAKIIAENAHIIAINDIAPKAPVHILVIPKIHLKSLHEAHDNDKNYLAEMMLMARDLSKNLFKDAGFRLLMNNGADVGQKVFHMHMHFLSGKLFSDF